jgi:DHA2 family multidrug resistance protein
LPPRWWIWGIAAYAFRFVFSQNIGASLEAWYSETGQWQWIFWQNVVLTPLMALVIFFAMPRDAVNHDLLHRTDWGGISFAGLGFGLIYAGLDQGNRLDWLGSGTVAALLISGGVLFAGFLVNEMVVRRPWAHVNVLFARNIGLSLVVILLYTLTGLSNSSLVPNFLGTVGQLRPEQAGEVLLVYGALPMLVTVPLSVFLLRHFDPRGMVVVGLSAFAVASLLGTQLTNEWRLGDFVTIVVLQSIGQSFTLFPLIIIAVSNADPSRATAFSAYIQLMRLGGAEIGVSLMGTWLRVREQIHSNYLGQHVLEGGTHVVRMLKQLGNIFAGDDPGAAQGRALGTLAALVQREANVLAYIDGFWLTFWLAIIALGFVALITRAPPGPFTPAPFGAVHALMRWVGLSKS